VKYDVCVPRDSPDMTPYKTSEKGALPESRDPLKFKWRLYALSEDILVL